MPPATGTSLPLKLGHCADLRKRSLGASPLLLSMGAALPEPHRASSAFRGWAGLSSWWEFVNTCWGRGRACSHVLTPPPLPRAHVHLLTIHGAIHPSIHPSVPNIPPPVTDPSVTTPALGRPVSPQGHEL